MAGFQGLPGDVIITPGMGLVRLLQTAPGEQATWAGHVAGLVAPGRVLHAKLRVIIQPLQEIDPPYQVWRMKGLEPVQRRAVADRALAYLGRSYGVGKIVLHAADWLLGWGRAVVTLGLCRGEIYAARRLRALDQYPICNWVWAQAYGRALGYEFGLAPCLTTPDEMHDWMSSRPEWEMVHQTG